MADKEKKETKLTNNYMRHEWPEKKDPCNSCLFRDTVSDGPYCKHCVENYAKQTDARK